MFIYLFIFFLLLLFFFCYYTLCVSLCYLHVLRLECMLDLFCCFFVVVCNVALAVSHGAGRAPIVTAGSGL